MPDTGFVALFLIGLLGGVHCIAMCGGIVGALSFQPQAAARQGRGVARWPLHLAYNLGRIASYGAAGALMGAIGGLGLLLNQLLPVQLTLYALANLMLVAMGLYLTGVTQALAFTERGGQYLWQHIQPLTRRFLPVRSVRQALPLGMLWGFLPCGLVYSALSVALLAGSAPRGAALMLAFGLGTLPNLLAAGLLLQRLQGITRSRTVRLLAGLLVLGFGLYGLFHAPSLGDHLWAGIVCRV